MPLKTCLLKRSIVSLCADSRKDGDMSGYCEVIQSIIIKTNGIKVSEDITSEPNTGETNVVAHGIAASAHQDDE
ncbi:unnamed protein product [Urochloa humidicola]